MTGATSLAGLTTSGATSLAALTVTGNSALAALTTSGPASLASLQVNGKSQLVGAITGGLTTLGSLAVTGTATLGSLKVTGDSTLGRVRRALRAGQEEVRFTPGCMLIHSSDACHCRRRPSATATTLPSLWATGAVACLLQPIGCQADGQRTRHVCGKHGVSYMPGHPHAPRSNTGSGAYAIQVIAGHSDLGDATVASTLPTNLNLQSLTIGTGGLTVTGATK